ncbi:UDP-glucose flavonoid 3-O-glucosyltransferase 7-like [Lotus japonicus]|uniref:UDP-glucose flavonoid 3-O-glucosyltransferase 7-like n=1 Tax=Lotus japonicus TaxID=34305 RepID=UPI0025881D89|nr:UDP-glucose flavonoid 3-O-glucosyltransferase 7-like [Lotus japonicus]XP_057415354.1 UDP-glucose flavonoid 3-O-glucosyltransferase 7-like [Lotus japonicus]
MDEENTLKLYFIPYLAAGHMIPLCDIATLFASRGQHVTIITTPSNAQILRKSISDAVIHLHTVQFPSKQVGLPDGVETMTALTNLADSAKFYQAAMLLQGPIGDFVEQNPPDCIVADFMMPWVGDLANRLRIPRLAFNGFSLFTVSAMESIRKHRSQTDPFTIPDFPHHITLRARPPKSTTGFMESLLEKELTSHGLIVNNFAELDGEEYIEHYERITGHKAWHLGPVSLIRRTEQDKAERGQNSVVKVDELLSWLNSKPLNSVLYICFGSVCHFPDNQLYEIASAIEASGYGFIWVVPEKKGKEEESEEEKRKWLPIGFEKKGIIIRGWAPQVVILGHRAVGAFVTHCGWNSTLEAVSEGVPMITWPVHSEQFYNEKLITEVRGIGVEVGAEEWSSIGFGEREKVVSRESIEKAVRRLMDGGDEAEQIRRRAHEYGRKARLAVEEGGSSHNNLTALIDDIKRLRA